MSKNRTLTEAEKARAISFFAEKTKGAILDLTKESKVSPKARAMGKVLYEQGGFGCQTDKIREVMEVVIGEKIPQKTSITSAELEKLLATNAGMVVVFTQGDYTGAVGLLKPGTVSVFLCSVNPGILVESKALFHNAQYKNEKGIRPFVRKATLAEITEFVNSIRVVDEESYTAFRKLITGA